MKVLCSEGIANHTGPESCVLYREMQGEALTGESVGQPLSRESFKSVQGADAVSVVEGNTDGRDLASACTALRGLRPWCFWQVGLAHFGGLIWPTLGTLSFRG